MKKILFFPHLRMQSGHHQAAEALMDLLDKRLNDVEMKKIDLFTETNKLLEKSIAAGYLKWIRHAPASYDFVYKHIFNDTFSNEREFKWYQPIFMRKMKQIIEQEQPDLIFCTHSFPSSMLSKLKLKGKCQVPVVNVYTDFFVNSVWGCEGVDAHLLPTKVSKLKLSKNRLIPKQMMVSGIPVHPDILRERNRHKTSYSCTDQPTIIVAGGNSGLGCIDNLFEQLKMSDSFRFKVLCGNNKKLLEEIESWQLDHIEALPYLSSRAEMNKLYNQADAMITKPGGVTISEGIKKNLPMFIHSALPGQEEINMDYLVPAGLVFELNGSDSLENQLQRVLMDETLMKRWQQAMNQYHHELDIKNDGDMIQFINSLLDPVHEEDIVELKSNSGFLSPVQE